MSDARNHEAFTRLEEAAALLVAEADAEISPTARGRRYALIGLAKQVQSMIPKPRLLAGTKVSTGTAPPPKPLTFRALSGKTEAVDRAEIVATHTDRRGTAEIDGTRERAHLLSNMAGARVSLLRLRDGRWITTEQSPRFKRIESAPEGQEVSAETAAGMLARLAAG